MANQNQQPADGERDTGGTASGGTALRPGRARPAEVQHERRTQTVVEDWGRGGYRPVEQRHHRSAGEAWPVPPQTQDGIVRPLANRRHRRVAENALSQQPGSNRALSDSPALGHGLAQVRLEQPESANPPTERGNTPGHKQAVARLFRPESRPTRPRVGMNVEPRLLRIADVIAPVSLSKGSIAKLGGCARWRTSDIDEWLASL